MTKECPYCDNTENLTSIKMRRPDQEIVQCTCTKYFVYNTRNGKEYKLENPLDCNSLPYSNKK
jgi:hypothetical protein